MTAAEERHLTMLEMQVGALIKQREHYAWRAQKLRRYIDNYCSHGPDELECPTCIFLREDANAE